MILMCLRCGLLEESMKEILSFNFYVKNRKRKKKTKQKRKFIFSCRFIDFCLKQQVAFMLLFPVTPWGGGMRIQGGPSIPI